MAPHPFKPRKLTDRSYKRLCSPLCLALADLPKLTSRGNRPLQMEFEDQLHALIFFHLQEHTSGRHLLQSLEEDAFAREHIASKKGIAKSSFLLSMSIVVSRPMARVSWPLPGQRSRQGPRPVKTGGHNQGRG